MLEYRLLRNHAGILLIGDYQSLRTLHNVIHDVNERSTIIKKKEGIFLGLAYDVRKAYEKQRQIIEPPQFYEEIGIRYGVEILWPVIILQQRMLRTALGYIDHSKRHQAITYALEAVIEEAIKDDFEEYSPGVISGWNHIDPHLPALENKLDARGAIFCSWTKKERLLRFAGLLRSFDSIYPIYYEAHTRNGAKNLVSPEEIESWAGAEWPDPKW